MKKLFYTLLLLFTIINVQSQTPTITMNVYFTADYTSFYFHIAANANNTNVQVDWGDGVLESRIIGTTISTFYGKVKGPIKIYGTGIALLDVWGHDASILTLDITNAIDLKILYCYWNTFVTLDVSKNIALETLECYTNLLTNIDISQNTALTSLSCSNNKLKTLDVSQNTLLSKLVCNDNRLTTIDLSKNLALKEFYCQSNNFTFSTLPNKQSHWTTYYYSPQLPLNLSKRKFSLGELIDLSDQLIVHGNSTAYKWKKESGEILEKGVDYKEDNGKFTFLVYQEQNVYCQMINATFPDLTLITEMITVPSSTIAVTMTTNMGIDNIFSFEIASSFDNKTIQVDWGNGILKDYGIGSSISSISNAVLGDTIKIYGLDIIYLDLHSKKLSSLDVTNATELQTLNCSSNGLTTLNLINNYALTDLQCQLNQITYLNLSNENKLSTILCYSNQLSTIKLPSNVALREFQCQDNLLRMNSLPVKQTNWLNYIYSPQQIIKLPNEKYEAPEFVDISNQLIVDGKTTTYTWKTKEGFILTSGVDYLYYFGRFNFLKIPNDSIYCEMTNASFPNLVLTTKAIAISLSSPNVSLTTTKAIGNTFSFNIYPIDDYSPIFADYGDGILVKLQSVSGGTQNVTLRGSTIKFYGSHINSLIVNNNSLIGIDISRAVELWSLSCEFNQLTSIDISKNNELRTLECNNNQISIFDVNNTMISYLDCSNNRLTTLDISKCTALNSLNCNFNQLTFFSLPLKQPPLQFYDYQYQATLKSSKSRFNVGEVIDLSNQSTVNGNATNFLWKNANGDTLIKGIDFSEDNGKFAFLNPQADYVFCQMTNSKLPDLILKTDTIAVPLENPLVTITTNTSINSTFSFNVTTTLTNKPIQVDWGNGNITDCTINNDGKVDGVLTGNTIKIYGIGIKSLNISSKNISNLILSNTNLLSSLDCRANQLTSIAISKATALNKLDCRGNLLISIDISQAISLKTLDCGSNLFTSLDLRSNSLETLNCASNKLTTLFISGIPSLRSLSCGANKLTFNTLPYNNSLEFYSYSPQQSYKFPKPNYAINETIDLSSFNFSNGYTTSYTWLTNEVLTSPVFYYYYNGLFRFQDTCSNIYCQMSNESFPYLVLETDMINIKENTNSIDQVYLKIKIFPNPVIDNLFIEYEEKIANIEVYTITGMKIYEKRGDNNLTMNIPTSSFPKGILIVKVYGKSGSITKKILKE